jgi:hypothetical protein
VLLERYQERADDYGYLHRWTDGGWKSIAHVTDSSDYLAAWPWKDGSILARASIEKSRGFMSYDVDRLAVVRGSPKAPSLAKLQRKASCTDDLEFYVHDIQVREGWVAVLAGCSRRDAAFNVLSTATWIGTWTADAPDVVARRLPRDFDGYALYLDDPGDGFVASTSETSPSLLRWSGGTAQVLEVPGNRLDALIQAGDGQAWIVQGSALSRWTGEGWEALPIPDGPAIEQTAGLEHGTPWLLRKGGALSMQTADGTWHDVAVPPTPELAQPPRIDTVRVVAPGDAWVQAEYSITLPPKKAGKRGKEQTMRALYTTRDAPVPLQCGQEPEAGATPVTGA